MGTMQVRRQVRNLSPLSFLHTIEPIQDDRGKRKTNVNHSHVLTDEASEAGRYQAALHL